MCKKTLITAHVTSAFSIFVYLLLICSIIPIRGILNKMLPQF